MNKFYADTAVGIVQRIADCIAPISQADDPTVSIEQTLNRLSGNFDFVPVRMVLASDAFTDNQGNVNRPDYDSDPFLSQVIQNNRIAVIDNDGVTFYSPETRSGYSGTRQPDSFTVAVPLNLENETIGALVASTQSELNSPEFTVYILEIIATLICQMLRILRLPQTNTKSANTKNTKTTGSIECGSAYGIVGNSKPLLKAMKEAQKAAASEATVMLVGESGCGKERFSRMIHLAGRRRNQPFVCVNCAAIPGTLLESELFGHEKGAFTGATSSRQGKFELAGNGTLFLDEIGDMTLDLQAKLLRVLQERSIQRLGSNHEIKVNARIITATHQNLQQAVQEGRFRLDLYYRLNVIPITLPPLRNRRDDVELLALYFLSRYNQRHLRNVALSDRAMCRLAEYDWPGNVRQLENVIERLVIMLDNEFVGVPEIERVMDEERRIHLNVPGMAKTQANIQESVFRPYQRVTHIERDDIMETLSQSGGNKTLAAQKLGLTVRQLRYRMQKLNI